MSGFSGQTIFERWSITCYNVVRTVRLSVAWCTVCIDCSSKEHQLKAGVLHHLLCLSLSLLPFAPVCQTRVQIFTSLPPFVIGLLDRDVSSEGRMRRPSLYRYSQERRGFNTTVSGQCRHWGGHYRKPATSLPPHDA